MIITGSLPTDPGNLSSDLFMVQDEVNHLDMFLGDATIAKLCEKLLQYPKKKLTLRGNQLGSKGAKAIAEVLMAQSQLQSVSLEWNHISSNGAGYLAEALKANHSLTYLDLRNNSINSEGAATLAEAIMQNDTLRTLDLRWNQIEDRGALAFKAPILERRPSLIILLNGNLLTEGCLSTIAAWMQKAAEAPNGDFDLPKPIDEPPKIVQLDFLQKEIIALRKQVNTLHTTVADLQRQLDTSSLRVTELEQQLAREEYRNAQATESLKQANMRNSILTDERNQLVATWEKERDSYMNEMMQVVKEKENMLKDVTVQRDNMKNLLDKTLVREKYSIYCT